MRDGLPKLLGLCLLAGVLVAGMLFPVVGGFGLLSNRASATVDTLSADLASLSPPLVTTVTDKDGSPIATLYAQYRIPVAPNQIANTMKAAIVAIEDRRFYDHAGVDWKSTLRAAINDVKGGSTQGASSITQQYVKNYLVNVIDRDKPLERQKDQEQTIARKMREARIAMQLDQKLPKDQILTGYLNVVDYNYGVYGVGAAARYFFNTTPDKLTVAQAALLAGVVNNPRLYDPWKHPQAALQRRNLVIDRMVQNQTLDPLDAVAAKQQNLGVQPNPQKLSSNCFGAPDYASFLCGYVEDYLAQAGISPDQVETGGYTIRTTMDSNIAKTVKASILSKLPADQDGVAQTFAVIQPGRQSHNVIAMVSNRSFGTDINKGQTSRNILVEPSNTFGGGSTFKIFTAAAALENGTAGLNTELPNTPGACYPLPISNRYTRPYCVINDNVDYANPIQLRRALATSPNSAFVGLELKTGMPKVLEMASRLGLRNTMKSNSVGTDPATAVVPNFTNDSAAYKQPQSAYFQNRPAFTLGVSAVSPLEMANVAATIMSGGVWCPPNPIISVTDRNGQQVPIRPLPCEQAVSTSVANALAAGLSDDSKYGTSAYAARNANWGDRPDIGKTGTTQLSQSVAFVGGANNYTVSSMVFADGPAPEPICPSDPIHLGRGCNAFGGTVAAPTFFDVFSQILAGQPDQPIPEPDPAFLDANLHGPIVPYVVNRKLYDATNILKRAGYHVIVQSLPSTAAKDMVIGQTPQGLVGGGSTITIYVSSGGS